MTSAFLMIVLTLSNGPQLSAAFVNTETLPECERRAAAVRGILDKGDVKIRQMACRPSNIRFEPFAHGVDEDAKRYAYVISIDDNSVTVEQVASCATVNAAGEGRYCATSTQKLLPQAQ
jgi:hypothetical protein